MVHDLDPITRLPDSVAVILKALDEHVATLDGAEQDNLAFNVLVNALSTVLERIRVTHPEQFEAYREMAQLMLKE